MNIRPLVEADILGEATDADLDTLEQDIAAWKEELVYLLKDIDRQLMIRRAQSIADGSKEVRIKYEVWKKTAVGRKLSILSRLEDVKFMLKEFNVDKSKKENNGLKDLLEQILFELQSFKETYERRSK